MIYIQTFAYNAQDTIGKTVESVLSQTVEEFQFYLLDNGSTDETGELIKEYAKRDSRIVPFYSKANFDSKENPEFWNLSKLLKDEDYFVVLDADDYYDPTFLEEMIGFIQRERLDVAACGTSFFDTESGVTKGERVLSESVIVNDKETWDTYFSRIHWNLRQVWGKFFSGKVAKHIIFLDERPGWWPCAYGGDTAAVLTCLKYADSFGVYGKVLHHYRVSKKSASYRWAEGREVCDMTLHQLTHEFILDKAGYLSDHNSVFLSNVYINAIKDTLNVLKNVEMDASKKTEVIWRMVEQICGEKIEDLPKYTRLFLEEYDDMEAFLLGWIHIKDLKVKSVKEAFFMLSLLEMVLLKNDGKESDNIDLIYEAYLNVGHQYMYSMYSEHVLNEENVVVLPRTVRFIYFAGLATIALGENDKAKAVGFLGEALKNYPVMHKVVEGIMYRITKQIEEESLEKQARLEEFNRQAELIKEKILEISSMGLRDQAVELLSSYKQINPSDVEGIKKLERELNMEI